MSQRRPAIIGHHLIWTLYGHWLANDLRGSGSDALREEKFAPLGQVHHGRKPEAEQPSRRELRDFYKQANPLLKFPKFWMDATKRLALGEAIEKVVVERSYTVWDALTMWHEVADATRLRLREEASLASDHPVWSSRPYKVFLHTPTEVWTRVRYVEKNPVKEGLAAQHYEFVQTYNNWPFHKPR